MGMGFTESLAFGPRVEIFFGPPTGYHTHFIILFDIFRQMDLQSEKTFHIFDFTDFIETLDQFAGVAFRDVRSVLGLLCDDGF